MKRKKRLGLEKEKEDRERNDALNKSEGASDRHLPGDYDSREDIMNRRDTHRVPIDVDNFSRKIGVENYNKPGEPQVTNPDDIQEEPAIANAADANRSTAEEMEKPVPRDLEDSESEEERTESDVTREDLEALGPRDLSMDMGEDETLKNRVWPVDMAGEDLDVPGSELDDDNEEIGSEDEENNSYSIGGDRHED